MTCETIRGPDGGTYTVCSRGRRAKKPPTCSVCHQRPATQLCDGPAPPGARRATCDAPLCTSCSAHIPVAVVVLPGQLERLAGFKPEPDDRDLCPRCVAGQVAGPQLQLPEVP